MCACLPVVWGCWAPTSSFPESCRRSRSSLQRGREQTEKKSEREFSTFPVNTIPLCFSHQLLKCNKWWITFPAACTEAWLLFQIKYKWILKFKRALCCISAIRASCFTSSAEYFNKYWAWMGENGQRWNQNNMKNVLGYYQWCWSHRPSRDQPIEGLLQTKGKVMAAFDWLVLEVGGTAGTGCCRGWLSKTCVLWALGASWSCSLCTLL